MTTTEKPPRILTFYFDNRQVKGKFIGSFGKEVQIIVTEDSENIKKVGDYAQMKKKHLTEYEDEIFIEDFEYSELSPMQKFFGRYYLGLIVILSAIGGIIYAFQG